ncbi:hypothetical protein BCON_0010g00690 [Botryotinia convoluta]|uniref:Uncharacterized protein n=1 Tax=Botryotinia convoluta TaxID=54673 RepID=A0A4Z1J4B1_9HELO|nr:hypothetical protein BCON_0010g00690 [Botryotinia convoluta]
MSGDIGLFEVEKPLNCLNLGSGASSTTSADRDDFATYNTINNTKSQHQERYLEINEADDEGVIQF